MQLTARNERNKEIAKNMLNQNIDVNLISNVTGLSIEEIKCLVEKKKVYSRKK